MVSIVDDGDSHLETVIWCQRLADVKVEVLTFPAVQETMVCYFLTLFALELVQRLQLD